MLTPAELIAATANAYVLPELSFVIFNIGTGSVSVMRTRVLEPNSFERTITLYFEGDSPPSVSNDNAESDIFIEEQVALTMCGGTGLPGFNGAPITVDTHVE